MPPNSDASTTSPVFRVAAGLFLALAFTPISHADGVDDLVKDQLRQQHIPGAAVAVLKAGKIIKVEGYGMADVELAVPVKTDTVFRLQSITKQFTATAVMLLVEEGKVRLDDPLNSYLSGCPPAWEKITVRHLLNQTSGLRDFINEPTINLRLEITEEEILASLATRPLKFPPGEAWDYSNTNYHLLAMIIRQVSGKWYGDFLAERIFRPLGMAQTAVLRDREVIPGRASGYAFVRGQLRTGSFIATAISSNGASGIRSTVLDLAKWDAALYTEQLLKRTTLEQMWSPAKLNNGTTHGYGFGWEIGEVAGHRRFSHAGNLTGFATQIDRFIDDQLTVVVLTNLADSAPARISRAVAGVYLPGVAAPIYKPIPDQEPAVTARFLDVLRRSNAGGLRPEEFTAPVWDYIASHAEQMRRDMAALGQIQKLTLVERTSQSGDTSYRYQARFARTSFIFRFVLTPDGKISMMMPEAVNQ